ncbi:MAG: AbrB/MazE/SpoVT family DNA-binding domain-containing protein [Oscillospiraceae bacterium]|nr:AbrB/MazE/SpoVT family DNA-binding domain-containing protein [Oscillospiraceae bacterium]
MTAKIQQWGDAFGISIPEYILDILKWRDNEQIDIIAENDRIIIERSRKRKNIKELFEDFEGEHEPVNIDWGEAVGDEIW